MLRRLLAVLTLAAAAFTTAGVNATAAHADRTYKGKVLLPAGTRLVTVKADGAWTLVHR
ncbi:hypothetical protein AB0B89_01460 [Sphaerisporangium sp. NPDC049002]|uniref:hypothetical protein n=1 Tax=Sphaerisporangium sp. NPDC049002 TaxID=3155392 RepID=UPI0034051769